MKKTTKLYDLEPYGTQFDAEVLSCEPHNDSDSYDIILDQTLFFPEEGGQNCDGGTLDGQPVLDVQIKDGVIRHTVSASFLPGTRISGQINWNMRYSNMQQHSGEHILSGLVHSHFGFDNVGFHLGRQNVTLDFNGFLSDEQLEQMETLANEAIYQNLGITACYPPKEELDALTYRSKIEIEGPVRIVTIPGYDICACCAPHVKQTGEIGIIKITDAVKYKGGIRLNILCGSRALTDYRQKQRQTAEISALLSARQDAVTDAVHRLKNDNFNLNGQLLSLQEQILEQKAALIPADTENLCLFEEQMESISHKKYANLLLKKCTGICAVFVGTEETGYRYIIASVSQDVRPVQEILKQKLQAKGGGSREMVQGSLTGSRERITSLLNI